MAATLVAVSSVFVVAGSASASPSSVKLVNTTPAAKGSLSSITWDLPGGEPTTLDYAQSADYSPDIMVSNMCDNLLAPDAHLRRRAGPRHVVEVHHAHDAGLQHPPGCQVLERCHADVGRRRLQHVAQLESEDGPVNGAYYEPVKTITATGPYQVTVKFSEPDELFVKEMATIAGSIAEKAYIDQRGQRVRHREGRHDVHRTVRTQAVEPG